MASVAENGRLSMSGDDVNFWYWGYLMPGELILALIMIVLILHLNLSYFGNTFFAAIGTVIWSMTIPMVLVYTPMRVGMSKEGVHLIFAFSKRIIPWNHIEFIGRMMFGVSNNYGVIAVFVAKNKVHSTGKFSSKVLEDMNYELRKRRELPT